MKVSLGELIDRYTIVLLKMNRIQPQDDEGTILLKEFQNINDAIEEYKNDGIKINDEWGKTLFDVNSAIWDLEADIRAGREGELGLEEVGRRAIEIRNLNRRRIQIKNEIADVTGVGYKDIKVNHASGE